MRVLDAPGPQSGRTVSLSTLFKSIALFAILTSSSSPSACLASSGFRSTLPAYAHNDYFNDRPLLDALRLGYAGVEVDCFLVSNQLLVAHDRRRVRPARSLEAMYLEPLHRLVRSNGCVLPDSASFTINIELKKGGHGAYAVLRETLEPYQDILTVVRNGMVEYGPVRVVLVGWTPSIEELTIEPVRYVSVHRHYDRLLPEHDILPSHLLSLVSLEYGKLFQWRGRGPMPPSFWATLASLVIRAHAVPGRRLRVYEVPYEMSVYRALLEAGVDLIGTKNLERSRSIVLEALQ